MIEPRKIINDLTLHLEQHTRGVQIGIYTIAGLGLAIAVHKVRPVSKFSRAIDVPDHFIKTKEVLRGRVVGCEPSQAGPRLLVDHRPPLRIPFWHSSKPPLPVQVWGVKLASGNGISWLQCIAVGSEATFTPLTRTTDALLANVTLHLPVTSTIIITKAGKKTQKKIERIEQLNVGERLVELGLGLVSVEASTSVPRRVWWRRLLTARSSSEALLRAQDRAVARRAGFWQETLPVSRFTILWKYLMSLLPASRKKGNQASK